MRIVFMGTPDFAVPSLTSLVEAGNEIALVVTRPDAVRGRGKKLEPSPVKAKALELGLPVIEANRMTPEVVEALQAAQADIFCVAAYGCILPDEGRGRQLAHDKTPQIRSAPCCLVGGGLLLFSVPFLLVMRLLAFLSCASGMAWIPVLIVPRLPRRFPVSMLRR